eukprot:s2204_g4.t2
MEREIRDAMDPQVSDAVKGKKLALFKEMLEFHKYLDLGVISELLDGADLTGDVPKTDMLPFKFIPALLTEESLMNQSKLRRPLVGRDCRGSGDDEVDESVWKQILEECQLGRMQFAESQIYGRIGRRCTKALREAAGRRRAKPLDREKLFLRLFANLLNAGKRRILSWDNTPSVVIFTDACYERNARDWICGLGAVMIDTLTGEKWVFSLHVDERQRAILGEANEKQIIFEAETFCAVLAYSFWMKSLDRRRSFLYVDNEGTKFCLMKGSSENAGVDLLCPEFAELCIQPTLKFPAMASKMQTVAAAAGAAALFGGATFVTSAGSSGNLRATVRSSNGAAAQAPSASHSTGFQLTATAAACVMAAQGRKAVTASKHQVTLTAFENELGVQAPVGFWDPAPVGFWDPVGFTSDGDVAAFKRRRSVELKHGRISMMATMGYITPEITGKLPGFLSPSAGLKFADIPNGLAAVSKVPVAGWAQIAAYFGFVEFSGGFDDYKSGTPGDYGFKDGLTGSAWGDWANYTASPLRAFENELGVQAPIGFFDPFGMTKDGDMEAFKRRRSTELKNGRVAMLATMGYIVPEYFRFPGFCSPSEGVKFADIPNGLAAISKVPAAGWTQWFLFLGLIEKGLYTYDPTRAPGDYKNAGVLGVPNGSTMTPGEGRNRKLNSELANGRLAMMAIIGMFFQDGLTGSAWGDWAQYTDSPLRAFENELGVQAPVGYFDPMGMSKDGDLKTFRRRRESELKNGRVAMFATMGFITPEYFRFPGYLSPAKELKFTDVPNGLAALSKVPLTGWIQILIFCGMVDFGLYRADDSRDPGDYETFERRYPGCAQCQRPHERRGGTQEETELRTGQWPPCHGGDHWYALPKRNVWHYRSRHVGLRSVRYPR